ncbi:unnamed protein product, partial [Staurois parvus]
MKRSATHAHFLLDCGYPAVKPQAAHAGAHTEDAGLLEYRTAGETGCGVHTVGPRT